MAAFRRLASLLVDFFTILYIGKKCNGFVFTFLHI